MTASPNSHPQPTACDGRAVDKPSSIDQTDPCPALVDAAQIAALAARSLDSLLELAHLEPDDIVVIGCSTSEINGSRIGSAGSPELAHHLLAALMQVAQTHQVSLAIQCCEHLNRALVVERSAMRRYSLSQVTVWPIWNAGGSLAAAAMDGFTDPVAVETVPAGAGMDIGHTLIGMHLRPVAVPVRLGWKTIGHADLVLARTRPKLIGGARACYSREDAQARRPKEAATAPEAQQVCSP